jgi:UDP-N-acetylglucosamine 4,6-dehydratase (inverting)
LTTNFNLEGKSILITGGTGSFGNHFVPSALERFNPRKLVVLSRDEMKQWEMAEKFRDDSRVRFFIGDVRDRDRLFRAFQNIDVVVHAAATKIVPTAEYNPFEAVKTNVFGAMNVIDAAIDAGVARVVALSTDKASGPINLYGATKLTSDKLFVAANNYSRPGETVFSVVRYGNVMGSRGSVIPYFLSRPKGDLLPITHPDMTRFMISLDQGVDLVWLAIQESDGGEIFVRKIPSMTIMDIAEAVRPDLKTTVIGVRPGEKLHEQMIGVEDGAHTLDFGNHYRIYPSTRKELPESISAVRVNEGFNYRSDSNDKWMSITQLRSWLEEYKKAASMGHTK